MEFARGKNRKLVLEVLSNILEGRIDVCPLHWFLIFFGIFYWSCVLSGVFFLLLSCFFFFDVKPKVEHTYLLEHIW